MKKKVFLVTGTRAEYGLLLPVAQELVKSRLFSPEFVVTGMHTLKEFGNTALEIRKGGIPVAGTVPVRERDDMSAALGKEVAGIGALLKKKRPAFVVVLGDRDEALAGALAAAHLKIPVAHINGGDVSGRGVDELLRHAITKASHIHFTSSRDNSQRVLNLGEEKWRVINVGATGLDGLEAMQLLPKHALARKLGLDAGKEWLLVVHHPTPLDTTAISAQIRPLLQVLAGRREQKIMIYPNSDTGSGVFIREIERSAKRTGFKVFRSLPRENYLNLLKTSDALLGNSSSGIIESSFFRLPTVNIGNRQLGRQKGANVITCGYGREEILRALDTALSQDFREKARRARSPYGAGDVRKKIIAALERFARMRTDALFFKKPPLKN